MCPQGQRRGNSHCDWNFCCKQQPPNLDAWPGETDIETQSGATEWRRGWDSNPRYGFPYARFRGEYFQPLSHLSAVVWQIDFSRPLIASATMVQRLCVLTAFQRRAAKNSWMMAAHSA